MIVAVNALARSSIVTYSSTTLFSIKIFICDTIEIRQELLKTRQNK